MPNSSLYVLNPDAKVAIGDSEILIESESTASRLSDDALSGLIEQIMGSGHVLTVDWDEAEAESPDKTEVLRLALEALVECQLIREETVSSEVTSTALSNRSGQQVSAIQAADRLRSATITARGEGAIIEVLREALDDFGLNIVESASEESKDTVHLVFGQDMYDPIFRKANEELLHSETTLWLPVVPPSGGEITIGPWIYPNESACFECYMTRRGSTNQEPVLQSVISDGVSVKPSADRFLAHPSLVRIQASVIADSIATHVALHGAKGQAPPGGLLTMTPELFGWETDRHRVLRVPRCKVCTRADRGYPQVWFHEQDEGLATHAR